MSCAHRSSVNLLWNVFANLHLKPGCLMSKYRWVSINLFEDILTSSHTINHHYELSLTITSTNHDKNLELPSLTTTSCQAPWDHSSMGKTPSGRAVIHRQDLLLRPAPDLHLGHAKSFVGQLVLVGCWVSGKNQPVALCRCNCWCF